MNVLIVLAHPCDDSFAHACADAARSGLERAGHHVDVLDLYREGFEPKLSLAELLAYDSDHPMLDPQVAEHAGRVGRSDALVFIYPTWWSGMPAMLKGWLERVLVNGVAFTLDRRTGKVRPAMSHIRVLAGISTYGSPRSYVKLVNDNGRRTITRALRMACGWRTRARWLALYAMDTASDAERTAFLGRITTTLAGW